MIDAERGISRPDPDKRVLAVLVALIAAFWVLGLVANALAPTLLAEHPLVLVALEPRNRYLLLTAGITDAVPFVLFATLRRIASDPVYYALGALYGDRAIQWVEGQVGSRGAKVVRLTERGYRRFSHAAVFLFPGLIVCVLAGATGMKAKTFLALNLSGTITSVILVRVFAHQLEGPVGVITDWNARNQTTLTVISIGLVVGYLVVRRLRGHSELDQIRSLNELDDDH